MLKSQEFRAKAEECDRDAIAACDTDSKIRFQNLARQWRVLEIQAALSKPSWRA
jgi:hypothetical protein